MSSISTASPSGRASTSSPPKMSFDQPNTRSTVFIFLALLAGGLAFTAYSIWSDVAASGAQSQPFVVYLLLAVALLIALGFEFVNGFHDTANAVATVIYTHSLIPNYAVMWSGFWNFLGVLFSAGTVAFGVLSLLPVELILKVSSSAGFAMVFALLIAAIIWNLGTWYFGLPASSSHTLVGSIIGVGIANALLNGRSGTAGVDVEQVVKVGEALLISPIVGFVFSALLLLVMKALVRKPALYAEPKSNAPPPLWIRGLLIFTCTGVSFFHGSNDGQKGMGLIMLVLIGTVPTAYALNRAVPDSYLAAFEQNSDAASKVIETRSAGYDLIGDPRPAVTNFVRDKKLDDSTYVALAALIRDVSNQVKSYGSLSKLPAEQISNTRNDMFLVSESLRTLPKIQDNDLKADEKTAISRYKGSLDQSTKFIPLWVKVAVAIALGLGTMIGWKRIVVTVGEKIGKTHLTYGQGAAAELVAMGTIAAADMYGLPVSTTHVLSSGVTGTMVANGSGIQWETLRNILLAWVLTLPCAIVIAGVLFTIFSHIF